MRVVQTDMIDPTQFDTDSPYYDSKSSPDAPRWWTVKVEFDRLFPQLLPLGILKQNFTADELLLVRTGNRLSVMPVNPAIATKILALVAHQGV
jgi:predicted RNA-binding protein with PUA-like domain